MSVLDVLIRRRVIEADGIVMLELVSATGEPLPPFEAGAHIDVHIGPDLIRQYSLCNDPAVTSCYRLGVLLDPRSRGGSAAVHATFLEGQALRIGLPRNNFPLAEGARRSILAAGGIGITPLLAMAFRLHATGAAFELHYCSRTAGQTAFRTLLAEAPFADRVIHHFDDGAPEQRFSPDAVLTPADADTHLYICGPSGFMDYVHSAAEARGWPAANIHLEHFGAEVDVGGDSFQVRAEQSGVTVTVGRDETIAQALEKAGVDILTSCEQGVCGACLTRVLAGEPDHRDAYQTVEEKAANSHVTICCSRSRSPMLVLDL